MADLTLEDIARQAGVSRSTVSRVVNDHPNVKPAVRQRVLTVIETTGYRPNPAARALASQRSWMIGLVLSQSASLLFTDPFYPHLIKGFARACNRFNYTLTLFLVGNLDDEKTILTRVTHRGLLDGVLVQSGHHGDQDIIGRLVEAGIPQVIIGRPFHPEQVSYVDIDNVHASQNAVSHLIRLGRRRIATITGPLQSTVGLDRREGYVKALTGRGLTVDEALLAEGDFTETGGYFAMKQLIPAGPDALFAASDVMALGAMRAAREEGLRVPGDVAVVGFDDLPIASLSEVPLTTVRQPTTELGERAVELLIDQIENGIQPPRHVIMGTELIVRESCGVRLAK